MRYRVRVPADADTKTFGDIGNLLTTSVSTGLWKGSSSTHLIHTIQSQEHNNIPYKCLKLWNWILGPFPPDVAHFLANDLQSHLLYKFHMTPLYDMNKVSTIGWEMEVKP